MQRLRAETDALRDAGDRFLASVSHELRTPLSAILLWTTLLEEEKLDDPAQLDEAIEAIKRSAEEQQALIENLVDTTRIVTGRLRLDRRDADIAPVLAAAIEHVQPAARAKHLAIETAIAPVSAPVDRWRLQQAVRLLLHNAVRFTPAHGRIEVSARAQGDTLSISVSDTGVGIPPDRLPQLFAGPPATAQSKAPRVDAGLGYGLLVVREIVAAHGGLLNATSGGAAQGAAFTIRLPLDARRTVPAAESAPVPAAEAPLSGRSVLLVVDEPEWRLALSQALQRAGAAVSAVDSAPAASEACERQDHDVILCDLTLPTIDAGELLQDVRDHEAQHKHPPAPALALAPNATPGETDRALAAGFARCIDFDPTAVVREVANSLPPARGG